MSQEDSALLVEIKEDVKFIKEEINGFKLRAVNWDNTTKIVFGMVTIMLTALVGAIIGLVII